MKLRWGEVNLEEHGWSLRHTATVPLISVWMTINIKQYIHAARSASEPLEPISPRLTEKCQVKEGPTTTPTQGRSIRELRTATEIWRVSHSPEETLHGMLSTVHPQAVGSRPEGTTRRLVRCASTMSARRSSSAGSEHPAYHHDPG